MTQRSYVLTTAGHIATLPRRECGHYLCSGHDVCLYRKDTWDVEEDE